MPLDKQRREAIKLGGAAITTGALGSLAGCTGGGSGGGTSGGNGEGTPSATPIHSLGTEGALYIPVFFLGRENDIWEKHGIDLSLEITGFGKFTRAFSANLSPLTGFPTLSGVQNINQGQDIV
ncbi:MAG: hypothetical protein R3324_14025, partial [Halobacteriales archaeon]|nr:hypothetical protein [Halobacteriales archaeon]